MFEVNNRFEIGEECWTTVRKPTKYKCPICEGNGSFMYNGYLIECKTCNSTGQLHNIRQQVLVICKVQIRQIKVTHDGTNNNIRYVVRPVEEDVNVKNRNESILFRSKDEVEEYCKTVNMGEKHRSFKEDQYQE